MSAISMGVNFGGIGMGRGFAANPHETGHPNARPETIELRSVEQSRGTRLVYDRATKRSYVEFLDYETGRVLDRFPTEKLSADKLTANSNLVDVLV